VLKTTGDEGEAIASGRKLDREDFKKKKSKAG
jgi:hypothetical protein